MCTGRIIIPGARRPHHPMPLVGVGPAGQSSSMAQAQCAVLPCVCGWRSTHLPFTDEPIAVLVAQHRAHVAEVTGP